MSTCHHSRDEGAKTLSVFHRSFVPYYKCNTNTNKQGRPNLVPRLLPLGTRLGRSRSSLVPRPRPLTRRNGLVNQVEFLGLVHTFVTM